MFYTASPIMCICPILHHALCTLMHILCTCTTTGIKALSRARQRVDILHPRTRTPSELNLMHIEELNHYQERVHQLEELIEALHKLWKLKYEASLHHYTISYYTIRQCDSKGITVLQKTTMSIYMYLVMRHMLMCQNYLEKIQLPNHTSAYSLNMVQIKRWFIVFGSQNQIVSFVVHM